MCRQDEISLSYLCKSELGDSDILGCDPFDLTESNAFYAYRPRIKSYEKGISSSIYGQSIKNPR